jgi:ATP-dependent DNA ligase
LIGPDGRNLVGAPLAKRRAALESFVRSQGIAEGLPLSPMSRRHSVAEAWLREAGQGSLDGVIAKRLDGPYEPGERVMVKVKPHRTADCVVGGFRYQSGSALVGSLLLGPYDSEGRFHHVGFTATIANGQRPALTRQLEALIEPPGFTGNAPGGPSRWSTERSGEWQPLRPELVVEVEYNQITSGRFRHGTRFIRWRPDKSPTQCTVDQIAVPQPR